MSPTPRILLAALLASLAVAPAAAADMSFLLTNKHPVAIAVELFGHGHVWPGGDKVYLLERNERKSVPIACEPGETICYGAWISGDDRSWWGVGPDNDHDCEKCCSICTQGGTAEIELGTEARKRH